jgi:hypothetical protein
MDMSLLDSDRRTRDASRATFFIMTH